MLHLKPSFGRKDAGCGALDDKKTTLILTPVEERLARTWAARSPASDRDPEIRAAFRRPLWLRP